MSVLGGSREVDGLGFGLQGFGCGRCATMDYNRRCSTAVDYNRLLYLHTFYIGAYVIVCTHLCKTFRACKDLAPYARAYMWTCMYIHVAVRTPETQPPNAFKQTGVQALSLNTSLTP